MDFINFSNVSFSYPQIAGDLDSKGQPIIPCPIFNDFSITLPQGFISIIGPNACGKSTFMLLAAGRLKNSTGKIRLLDKDITTLEQTDKNLVATFLYQNMEFETYDKTKDILAQVYQNGNYKGCATFKDPQTQKACDLLDLCIKHFALENLKDKQLNHLSKGEMQRVLLAFCLLYGSKSVFMDEPFFAMQDTQKHCALTFLKEYAHESKNSFLISMHEIDLTKKYADFVFLLFPNKKYITGTPSSVLTPQNLEAAYEVPYSMLKHTETLTRKQLQEFYDAISSKQSKQKDNN